MAQKPTYEELAQRVKELEEESFERKQAEEKLRHQKKHLEALIEYSSLSIVTLDEGHNIITCNRDFEKLFHFKESEIVGRNLDEIIAGQEYIKDATSYTKETLKGKAIHGSGKRKRKDGTYIDVEFTGVPVIIDGKVIGAYGIYLDISERKRVEEETERRVAQVELVYEVAHRVTSELELKALFSETVTAVCDAFDYYGVMLLLVDEEANRLNMQSIAGGYVDIFPKDLWLAKGEGMIGYAAATGETQLSGDITKHPHFVRKADEETKSELAVPIKSGQEVIGVLDLQSDQFNAFDKIDVVVMETLSDQLAVAIRNAQLYETVQQELTERKQAEGKLRESEGKYRLLVNNIPSIVYKGYKDWSVDFFDEKIESLTGYTADEFNSKRIKMADIIVEEDIETAREAFVKALKTTDKSYVREYRIKSKTGDIRWTQERGHIICDTKGEIDYVSGVFFDITDRKHAEEEREKLIKELQEALKEIKTLRGILPLCSFCKKIRDDKGYWEQVDVYIHKHSQADISHGICPECAKEHYPDLDLYDD